MVKPQPDDPLSQIVYLQEYSQIQNSIIGTLRNLLDKYHQGSGGNGIGNGNNNLTSLENQQIHLKKSQCNSLEESLLEALDGRRADNDELNLKFLEEGREALFSKLQMLPQMNDQYNGGNGMNPIMEDNDNDNDNNTQSSSNISSEICYSRESLNVHPSQSPTRMLNFSNTTLGSLRTNGYISHLPPASAVYNNATGLLHSAVPKKMSNKGSALGTLGSSGGGGGGGILFNERAQMNSGPMKNPNPSLFKKQKIGNVVFPNPESKKITQMNSLMAAPWNYKVRRYAKNMSSSAKSEKNVAEEKRKNLEEIHQKKGKVHNEKKSNLVKEKKVLVKEKVDKSWMKIEGKENQKLVTTLLKTIEFAASTTRQGKGLLYHLILGLCDSFFKSVNNSNNANNNNNSQRKNKEKEEIISEEEEMNENLEEEEEEDLINFGENEIIDYYLENGGGYYEDEGEEEEEEELLERLMEQEQDEEEDLEIEEDEEEGIEEDEEEFEEQQQQKQQQEMIMKSMKKKLTKEAQRQVLFRNKLLAQAAVKVKNKKKVPSVTVEVDPPSSDFSEELGRILELIECMKGGHSDGERTERSERVEVKLPAKVKKSLYSNQMQAEERNNNNTNANRGSNLKSNQNQPTIKPLLKKGSVRSKTKVTFSNNNNNNNNNQGQVREIRKKAISSPTPTTTNYNKNRLYQNKNFNEDLKENSVPNLPKVTVTNNKGRLNTQIRATHQSETNSLNNSSDALLKNPAPPPKKRSKKLKLETVAKLDINPDPKKRSRSKNESHRSLRISQHEEEHISRRKIPAGASGGGGIGLSSLDVHEKKSEGNKRFVKLNSLPIQSRSKRRRPLLAESTENKSNNNENKNTNNPVKLDSNANEEAPKKSTKDSSNSPVKIEIASSANNTDETGSKN